MRSKASGLALVVVAGLVAGCASSGYQPEVDWPAGWQVITESIPPEANDVEQLGSRQLATKLGPGGEKEASIELLSLKMMEEESVELVPMSHTCTPADEICAFLAKSASLFRLAPWRSPSLR
ncbi:DUF4946 domain-containing protein [Pseudomonas aeruginosa]|nr:DUF4946 domain-containing protein [Pseudomonas aeruginosa]